MSKISGGCLCGSVRYESSGEPLMTAACHCKHCQKQSGTAFSVVLAVPTESLHTSGDTLKSFADTGESGEPVLRKFCGNCGSPVLSSVTALAGMIFIKAGTLDDSSWVVPESEIWCESKVNWGNLGQELPKIPGNPPMG